MTTNPMFLACFSFKKPIPCVCVGGWVGVCVCVGEWVGGCVGGGGRGWRRGGGWRRGERSVCVWDFHQFFLRVRPSRLRDTFTQAFMWSIVVDFGQFRLRPTSTSANFRLRKRERKKKKKKRTKIRKKRVWEVINMSVFAQKEG